MKAGDKVRYIGNKHPALMNKILTVKWVESLVCVTWSPYSGYVVEKEELEVVG